MRLARPLRVGQVPCEERRRREPHERVGLVVPVNLCASKPRRLCRLSHSTTIATRIMSAKSANNANFSRRCRFRSSSASEVLRYRIARLLLRANVNVNQNKVRQADAPRDCAQGPLPGVPRSHRVQGRYQQGQQNTTKTK